MEIIKKFGWNLSEDAIFNYLGDDAPANGDAIHKILLDCDIREIASSDEATGPIAQTNSTNDISTVPLILQIQKVRNVAVPKAKENDTSASDRLLRLTLTDGKISFSALEMGVIKGKIFINCKIVLWN